MTHITVGRNELPASVAFFGEVLRLPPVRSAFDSAGVALAVEHIETPLSGRPPNDVQLAVPSGTLRDLLSLRWTGRHADFESEGTLRLFDPARRILGGGPRTLLIRPDAAASVAEAGLSLCWFVELTETAAYGDDTHLIWATMTDEGEIRALDDLNRPGDLGCPTA